MARSSARRTALLRDKTAQHFESRRHELSLTFVGDHAYADCEGQSFDGPLTRATP